MTKTIYKIDELTYSVLHDEQMDKTKKHPALIFLHGAGSRGTDINRLFNNPFFGKTSKAKDFDFVTVAPLCSQFSWFDHLHELKKMVKEIAALEYVDVDRIYLIGASMGGYATWQLAMSMPEYFAAIAPICGGGIYAFAERLVNTPVWAFHGAKDDVVFVEESKRMVNAVNAAGGCAKLTIYPENSHNAWSDTYANKEVFEWMLSHKRQSPEEIADSIHNSEIYG